jgi:hypothetical protein
MVKLFGMNGSQEPTLEEIHQQQGRRLLLSRLSLSRRDERALTTVLLLVLRSSLRVNPLFPSRLSPHCKKTNPTINQYTRY